MARAYGTAPYGRSLYGVTRYIDLDEVVSSTTTVSATASALLVDEAQGDAHSGAPAVDYLRVRTVTNGRRQNWGAWGESWGEAWGTNWGPSDQAADEISGATVEVERLNDAEAFAAAQSGALLDADLIAAAETTIPGASDGETTVDLVIDAEVDDAQAISSTEIIAGRTTGVEGSLGATSATAIEGNITAGPEAQTSAISALDLVANVTAGAQSIIVGISAATVEARILWSDIETGGGDWTDIETQPKDWDVITPQPKDWTTIRGTCCHG